jgi:hypothetical protein
MITSKPLTTGGKVGFWLLIVFVVVIGVGGGTALIVEGLNGRDAVAEGPVGTFTPTDRECGKDSCTWVGEFVSDDGAITRDGVELRGERVGRGDPMPADVGNVRLHDDDRDPVAYTDGYNPVPKVVGGAVLMVFCLVVAVVLVVATRRRVRATAAGRRATGPSR